MRGIHQSASNFCFGTKGVGLASLAGSSSKLPERCARIFVRGRVAKCFFEGVDGGFTVATGSRMAAFRECEIAKEFRLALRRNGCAIDSHFDFLSPRMLPIQREFNHMSL